VTALRVDRHLSDDYAAEALRADATAGLTSSPKWLHPKWFYDERGSELFEQITTLPEYYPFRAEREILATKAHEIAAVSGVDGPADTLVELGSGSSEKTRLLLDALRDTGSLRRYVPVDVSDTALLAAGEAVRAEYPGLDVHAVIADFTAHLELLPAAGTRTVAFLGGTVGNLTPDERAEFLSSLREGLRPGETLLLGTDLVKSPDVLVPAYDDAAGVTAAFNLNVLDVLNRELKADFDPAAFTHRAVWNADDEWIEMRLRSTRAQTVNIAALDMAVSFAEGEEMRTEISSKFRRERVAAELDAAGFALRHWWTDAEERFALSLAEAVR
jgi:L-histidine Nalpha-methyltransferase